MSFPSSIDSFAGFTSSETLSAAGHAAQSNQEQAAIVALENKLGTGSSTPSNGQFLAGNGTGSSVWRALTYADIGLSPLIILQLIYPIGYIYQETTGVNPSITFGFGTWIAFAPGRVLVGAGTSDQVFMAGNTGGESNHTLVSNEMPSHTHTVNDSGHTHTYNFNSSVEGITAGGSVGTNTSSNTGNSTTGITNNNTGGGAAHNNLQPYLVVYFWERTA